MNALFAKLIGEHAEKPQLSEREIVESQYKEAVQELLLAERALNFANAGYVDVAILEYDAKRARVDQLYLELKTLR